MSKQINNTTIKDLIQKFDFKTPPIASEFLAFKTTPKLKTSTNPYTTIDYCVYSSKKLASDKITKLIQSMLQSLFNLKLNSDHSYEVFDMKNGKDVRDYVDFSSIDFTKEKILSGEAKNLDADAYKVAYLNDKLKISTTMGHKELGSCNHTALRYVDKNKNTLIILNKNVPLVKNKNTLFCIDFDEDNSLQKLSQIKKPMIKFPPCPHALIINNTCILFENFSRDIFGFEKYNLYLCETALQMMIDDKILTDESYPLLKAFTQVKAHYNLFATFDFERYEEIKEMKDKEFNKLLNIMSKLSIDMKGTLIHLQTSDDCDAFISYLCKKIALDFDTSEPLIIRKAKLIPKKEDV